MKPPFTWFSPMVLRDTAGGDDALARELVEIFLRIVPPMTARLRQAADAVRPSAIADEAHSLRSCLAMVGAADLSVRCRLLETRARRHEDALGPEATALCKDVERAVAEVRAFQRKHAAHIGE